jgi:hypothetical protein
MSTPDVLIILIDQNLNLLLIPDNTKISFIKTNILRQDYPLDNNLDIASKNAIIRYLREMYGYYIKKERIYDPNFVTEENGSKHYIYLYFLEPVERKYLQQIPFSSFVQFNSLPLNLNSISASAAIAITRNFTIIKSIPLPPNVFINYPTTFIEYRPSYVVPILVPYIIYVEKQRSVVKNPIEKAPIVPRIKSNSPTYSETIKNKRVSPKIKKIDIPIVSSSSPKIKRKIRSSQSTPRINSSSEKLSKKSSVKSSEKVSEKSSIKLKRKSPRNKKNSKKDKYYLKYIKYKIKYLRLLKQLLE